MTKTKAAIYLSSFMGLALIVAVVVTGIFAVRFHKERDIYKETNEELAVYLETSRADNVEHLAAIDGLRVVNTQLETDNQRLTSETQQLRISLNEEQQRLAQNRAALKEVTAGPLPQVMNSSHRFASTGFWGTGPKNIVIKATVVDNGNPGMVQISGTARWDGGTRTEASQEYFGKGQQKDVELRLVNIPRGATHTVAARAN